MTPTFGHFIVRSITVPCTLPIYIGQILMVFVLVYIQGVQHKGWFLWSLFGSIFSHQMQQTSCGLFTNYQHAKCKYNFHEPVSKSQARLTHMTYVRDTFYYKTVGCSYEAYIIKMGPRWQSGNTLASHL